MAIFKFKVWFSTEKTIVAENTDEAKGILKGMAVIQLPGFKFERADSMKPDPKIKNGDK